MAHVLPPSQTVLLLHAPKKCYCITDCYPMPAHKNEHEVLIQVKAIGLNPIDWKAPDFNFGIPSLPYIAGRELSGVVISAASNASQWKKSDKVIAISTDYRDIRKGAFQQFVIANDYNLVRLPPSLTYEQGSTVGVAFVAASLALGVSLGADFSSVLDGPDLFRTLRNIDTGMIPDDVVDETLHSLRDEERLREGDWLVIWGGSAVSANLAIQLAKLVGLRVIAVVDNAKHGVRLSNHGAIRPDLLVDSYDADRAVQIIKSSTKGRRRYGLDTRGKDTTGHLLRALLPDEKGWDSEARSPPTPPGTPSCKFHRTHVVGMAGLPKLPASEGYVLHSVPVKLFHEVHTVGASIANWFGRLLKEQLVVPADIIDVQEGLHSINSGLDRMRRGEISGGKLVVRV